jgi:hypothetical protein
MHASIESIVASDLHAYRSGAAIHLVATTPSGTRAAMRAATALANGLDSRVHVIAARQMPSDRSLDQRSASARTFAQEIMALPEATPSRVKVLPCFCKRLSDVVQLLPPKAVVVIGGHSRWWWPSREQRLAKALRTAGHHVLFVHADREGDSARIEWRHAEQWERT